MRHLDRFILCLIILISTPVLASPQEDLNALLVDIKTIEASFLQSTTDPTGEIVNVSEGKLSVGEQGKFNINTQLPFEQNLVSNGEDFYTYDPDLEQVIIRRLVKDVNQVPILLLGNTQPEFLNAYHITQIDEQTHSQFLLKAKSSESVLDAFHLTFNGAHPSKIVIIDTLGQTTEILLSEINVNSEIAEERFAFVIPPDVDVIDDR